MIEHTPGPWEVNFSADELDAVIFHSDHGTIANMSNDLSLEIDISSMKANARLISFSPEMYDGLYLALGIIETGYAETDADPDVIKLRNILNRIENRSEISPEK